MSRAVSGRWLLTALAGITVCLFAASLLMGQTGLLGLAVTRDADADTLWLILTAVRLPRALLAVLVGASLGLAGAVLQGMLRNPLADPAVLGPSTTAALGSVLAFYFGLSGIHPLLLPLGGIMGGLLGVGLVLGLAGRSHSALTLILAGAAVNSLAGALTALALNLAPNPFAALEIMFWLMGSLSDRSMDHVWLAAPFVLVGAALLATTGSALDALALGEDTARSLGVGLGGLRLRVVLGVGVAVGAAVAVAGSIGFVGLMVPHLLRPLVGQRPARLLLPSALGGAALLLAADLLVRVPMPGPELKVGVVTALLGAPFFLLILLRHRERLA